MLKFPIVEVKETHVKSTQIQNWSRSRPNKTSFHCRNYLVIKRKAKLFVMSNLVTNGFVYFYLKCIWWIFLSKTSWFSEMKTISKIPYRFSFRVLIENFTSSGVQNCTGRETGDRTVTSLTIIKFFKGPNFRKLLKLFLTCVVCACNIEIRQRNETFIPKIAFMF